MANGRIYLANEASDSLITFEESGYLSELELQEFLAEHPNLLAGDQIDPENPRRWLLVSREMGVPGAETETGRWSLDHLFIDQDGIPTFVECKRSTDTRIRREVVAQMLDYAANGAEYWNIGQIIQAASETAERLGKTVEDVVIELLDGQGDLNEDEFWSKVEDNLQKRKLRLIFVADRTPRELRRLIEFLNDELANVEVLAIEVKQYRNLEDPTEKALVPRVIGMTESARQSKRSSAGPRRKTNQAQFQEDCLPEARPFFDSMLELSVSNGYALYWGTTGFSVRGRLAEGDKLVSFAYGYPPDKFEFHFHSEGQLARGMDSPLRRELLEFGLLEEAGDYTLRARIDALNTDRLIDLYRNILVRIGEFEEELHPKLESARKKSPQVPIGQAE